MNRRTFLRAAAGGAAMLGLSRRAFAYEQSPTNLRKFLIGLPGLGPSAANEVGQYIPIAQPNTSKYPGCDYYNLVAGQYNAWMHPDLPKPTTLWGYADAAVKSAPVFQYLGAVISATSGRPVRMTMTNQLPPHHILPVDTCSFFMDAQTYPNKIATHLHGGFVPWVSDGGPFGWYTPSGGPTGPNYPYQVPDMPPVAGGFNYYYPNQQSARLMWYHDHAHDITRLNAYAGLASAYLLSDSAETSLTGTVIPSTQIPLILQDKGFKSKPDQWGMPGDLWYPSAYEYNGLPENMAYSAIQSECGMTARWERGASGVSSVPFPSAVPEAFFDSIVVNGAVFPYLNLPAKRYRFRILNASQARFFNLQLYVRDNSADGITLRPTGELDNNGNPIMAPTNKPGPAFIQIGSEGGLLPAPVVFNTSGNVNSNRIMGYDLSGSEKTNPTWGNAVRYNLLLAPAERADVIIDLRGFENRKLILYNDAPAPFPSGDIRNDYYAGAPDLTCIGGAPTPLPGYSPGTRTLMVINVGSTASDAMTFADTISQLQTQLPTVFAKTQPAALSASNASVRPLTLNEDFDDFGRLIQKLGTTSSVPTNNAGVTTYGLYMDADPTETPSAGSTEIWRIFNLTGDTHPVHFHLVNVQVLGRATFADFKHIGKYRPPDPNEKGWKETVRMNPGEVTDVIMQFNLPTVPFNVPLSYRTSVPGYEYVWHCHILEHEEHEMMRPLIVTP